MNYTLGCIPSKPDIRDYKYFKVANIVKEVVPQDIDYRPFLPPCFDQDTRGCCVAEGGIGLKAHQEIKQGDYPINGLSVAHLYTECKKIDGDTTEGTMPKNAMQVLQKIGVCTEDTMPFSTLNSLPENTLPTIPSKAITEASKYKINTYAQLCSSSDKDRSGTLNAMRVALKNEGVFTLAFLVCSNFKPDKNGFLPLPEGSFLGGHQVSIVGDLPNIICPDGSKGALILRNSWGIEWGLNGNAYLPYSWLTAWCSPTGNMNDKYWYIFEAWTATDIPYTPTPIRGNKIIITIGQNTMIVDGYIVTLDQPVIIDSKTNRTLLPVRAIAEYTGYTVVWDAKTPNNITLTNNTSQIAKKIEITIGVNFMIVDGVKVSLDQPAVVDSKTNRTLLPVRALTESMGYIVNWDSKQPNIIALINKY